MTLAPRTGAIFAGRALVGDRLASSVRLELDESGRIETVDEGAAPREGDLDWGERLVVPGTCNVHSHSFQVLLRGRCEAVDSFADWVSRRLYPLVERLELPDIVAAARLAFGEMLLNGVTLVGEFHYLNRGRGGSDVGNEQADAVIEAARSVGLRITLLRSFYDRGGRPGRERFVEPADLARRRADELREAWRDCDDVAVGAAPHSLHGASPEALTAARDWAEERDAPLHVHLAEQRSDLESSLAEHGTTPLRALDAMGLVVPRLVAVHGCWLDGDEIRRMGEVGCGLAYNPASNMALGDGVTDVEAMVDAGVRVSLGTDGACANNQFDVFREMRTCEHLQRVSQHRMGVLTSRRGGLPLVEMGTENGYRNLGWQGGRIEPGAVADLLALDPDDPSLQPMPPADRSDEAGEWLASQLAFAVSIRGALTDVVVGARQVVADRRPTLFDPAELAAAVNARPL